MVFSSSVDRGVSTGRMSEAEKSQSWLENLIVSRIALWERGSVDKLALTVCASAETAASNRACGCPASEIRDFSSLYCASLSASMADIRELSYTLVSLVSISDAPAERVTPQMIAAAAQMPKMEYTMAWNLLDIFSPFIPRNCVRR